MGAFGVCSAGYGKIMDFAAFLYITEQSCVITSSLQGQSFYRVPLPMEYAAKCGDRGKIRTA